jgi:hypothetical protein
MCSLLHAKCETPTCVCIIFRSLIGNRPYRSLSSLVPIDVSLQEDHDIGRIQKETIHSPNHLYVHHRRDCHVSIGTILVQSLVCMLYGFVQIKNVTWQMLRRQYHLAVEYVAAG